MKKLLLIVTMILLASSAYSQKEKLTKQQKKEAKEAALVKELDSLIVNSCFDFYSTMYEETYGGIRRTPSDGGIEFYPTYCDIHLKNFNLERAYASGYTVQTRPDGWIVVFTVAGPGINGNDYYDGVNKTFRFELTVDRDGKAVLRVTTEFNDHKYPHIYKGKITKNTKN